VQAPGALAYDSAGVTATFATLLAYWQRLKTGRGQHVDVSVMESVANLSDWAVPGFSTSGQVGKRDGAGIYVLYPCADGFVRMIVLVAHHWKALLDWMGNPPELADPALTQFIARLMRRQEIDPHIIRFFADQKKVDIAREAQRRGIPVTPLLEPSEVIANEHTQARGTFATFEVVPGYEAQVASGFLLANGVRLGPRERAPLPGEHNAEILGGELGLGERELEALRAQGVI
jgi:crotonobetainyl-CoA:carnitine CoA-transferase CaiB-like acyl-CoA transferase